MANINEILARAAALRDETALNSIDPERAGGIMYDTLIALNEIWLQGSALVISKIYASVAAMEADTSPVSDLTGQPLRPGQIVVIASSDSDNGSIYRYNGTSSPNWSEVGQMGSAAAPIDSLDSDSTTRPLAAHQGKVLDGKISQLGQEDAMIVSDVYSKIFLEIGSLNSQGQNEEYNLRARTKGYLRTPFTLSVKEGFGIFYLFKYELDAQGNFNFVNATELDPLRESISLTDGAYYRIIFRKPDNSEILVSDLPNIISSYDGKIDREIEKLYPERKIKRNDVDMSNYGLVNSLNGNIEYSTSPNYWNKEISLVGVSGITCQMFGSSTYGLAFYDINGVFIEGKHESSGGIYQYLIPNGAVTMKYSYPSDSRAEYDNEDKFESLGLQLGENNPMSIYGLDYRIRELNGGNEKRPRPETGAEAFVVTINGNYPLLDTDQQIGDIMTPLSDWGNIWLPENYDPNGEPVPLAIICHGSGATLDKYKYCQLDDGKYLYDPAPYLVAKGYACMDMYAHPGNPQPTDGLHLGNPLVLLCYKAGYDYVIKHYNVRADAVFVSGSSMGGLSSFQIVQSGLFPVKAQAGFCPVTDLFKQAYCNPWRNSLDNSIRTRIQDYFKFTGTSPQLTTQKPPSQAEIDYFFANLDKIVGYNPISRMLVGGDYADTFDYIPQDVAVLSDQTEKAIYDGFRAIHPCPVKIWHNQNDSVVAFRYSQYLIDMLRRSGQLAFLRPFTGGGHSGWDWGDVVSDTDVMGNPITTHVSQRECFLWFERFK